MKLHADSPTALNSVTAYGPGFVEVNQIRHHRPLLVMPDRPVEPWDVASFDTLSTADFSRLRDRSPELVVLGTGARQRFAHPRLLQPLLEARIGCETMTSPAACRTYNILMNEGRKVLAAILFDD